MFGPSLPVDPDREAQFKKKARQGLKPEEIAAMELRHAFPMCEWSWSQRHDYLASLDPVLYHHITGGKKR